MQVRSMGPISEMDMVSFIFLSTGNSLRITYHIININLKISRVTSWIATSVSPGWIRDSLLLDTRLLNMHYSSIVNSFRSSTFEATNNEKSNDKRLSAPAPFLICSTTCVWSLKSGGYGGEGRRLMSISNYNPSTCVFFSEFCHRTRNTELEVMSIKPTVIPQPMFCFFLQKLRRDETKSLIITKHET